MNSFDVLVIGGGNAGLCAALSAADRGKRVLLLERAPWEFRGGNSKYTRDIRCCQNPDKYASGTYEDAEFLEDVVRVTGGTTNTELAKKVIADSWGMPKWMESQGVKWQKALRGTLHLSRTNRFFIGGGKALVNTYYNTAVKKGVRVMYDATVEEIRFDDGRFSSATVANADGRLQVTAGAVVVASGGFEANLEWLGEYWGSAVDNFIIRGSRFNDGSLLRILFRNGAHRIGDPKQFHSIAVDARSPRSEGGIVTRIDSLPFGIVVNKRGKRFYDEGEDLWPKRYAIWGKLIAEQPDQLAFSIFDSRVLGTYLPPLYPPFVSDSHRGLAEQLEVDRDALLETLANYNSHLVSKSAFDSARLDGNSTDGLTPPKSHWALPIDRPPFYAYPLRPGITFTYMGIEVTKDARIVGTGQRPFENAFAAGEIMAGNILTKGYLAGFGLTIGTSFGRTAGEEASEIA